jgi:nucleoside-diphosphate-sugar epimerase
MTSTGEWRRILVTGGAGYVGSALVPALRARGHLVRVLDLMLFGRNALAPDPGVEVLEGDIRDTGTVEAAVAGCDAVIHLACVSNDPSFELDPALGRSINFDAFGPLARAARAAGVRRFLLASSSSVYGVRDEPEVTEELEPAPITDYARFKADCEKLLFALDGPDFVTAALRPAAVCGFAPRLRLDIIVNILTHHAVLRGVVKVFGGRQMRPNMHIDDMVGAYLRLLDAPAEAIRGEAFNVGHANHRVDHLAALVRDCVGPDEVRIQTVETNDPRSYRICSDKAFERLGYRAERPIEQAVAELAAALRDGRVPNSETDERYYNVRLFKRLLAEKAAPLVRPE